MKVTGLAGDSRSRPSGKVSWAEEKERRACRESKKATDEGSIAERNL